MGPITRSASAKVSRTIGSGTSASMFTYCEPWPGNKKATLPAGPRRKWMPLLCSTRHFLGSFWSRAARAVSHFFARSAASSKAITRRAGAARKSGPGGCRPGVWPALAPASAWARAARTAPASAPPTASMLPSMDGRVSLAGATSDEPPAKEAGTCTAGSRRVSMPGTYSSTTTWKLVPPKPNADRPQRRGPNDGFSHGWALVFTNRGVLSQEILGFG